MLYEVCVVLSCVEPTYYVEKVDTHVLYEVSCISRVLYV